MSVLYGSVFGEFLMENGQIFLISTDPIMRNYLKNFISHFDRKVYIPINADVFWEELELVRPLVVVYHLSRINPTTLQHLHGLKQLEQLGKSVQVILLSSPMQLPLLQDLARTTSWKIVTKPFVPQDFKACIMEVLGKFRDIVISPAEIVAQSSVSRTKGYHPQLLLETSHKMREVKTVIDQVANTDVTILIRGESGTGKELVARSLYECSNRFGKPFVTVHCPAIPEGLMESELFGYEKGSFTGAFRRRPGKFEMANQGMIFLDEIGDIPFELQSKLLHVLQRSEFSLIGGGDIKVDVRILAATNKDLEKAVADGTFREDLYYRLNVVGVFIPPLRERREDIPILIDCFLQKYNQQFNKESRPLSAEALQSLMDYDWPGNVRELENLIKRVVIMGSEEMVVQRYMNESGRQTRPKSAPVSAASVADVEDRPVFPEESQAPTNGSSLQPLKLVAREAMKKAEGEAILKALEQTRWNRKAAARLLQISYKALLYKIRQCNLNGGPGPSEPVL